MVKDNPMDRPALVCAQQLQREAITRLRGLQDDLSLHLNVRDWADMCPRVEGHLSWVCDAALAHGYHLIHMLGVQARKLCASGQLPPRDNLELLGQILGAMITLLDRNVAGLGGDIGRLLISEVIAKVEAARTAGSADRD